MPPSLRVAVPLAVLAAIPLACSSAPSPDGAPPVALVERAVPPPPRTETAPAPANSAAVDCNESFVEAIDAGKTVRYALGRELVAGVRGAKHAYGETILHRDGSVVLHVEGLAANDGHGGHVTVTLMGFHEPSSLPAVFEGARVEYMAPGLTAERDERRLDGALAEITGWGPEGAWIEGTFGPAPAARAIAPFRGRFRVCRTADWRPRI
jgi:hypothetical protein